MSKIKNHYWNEITEEVQNDGMGNPDNVGYPNEGDCHNCHEGNYQHQMEDNNGQVIEADICDNCGADWSLRPTVKADF